MKRPFEGGDGPSRKGRKGEGVRTDVGPCVLKFLAPEVLCSAVIGKGGTVIAKLREATQTKIAFSDHGEFYPGTDSRVLTASGNGEDSLNELSRLLIGKVVDCAQAGASEAFGTPDELKLRTVMPRLAVGGIIGKGGAAIKRLREMSGAKVHIDDAQGSGPGAEQIVTITGTQQGLEYVMQEANTQIQNLGQEDWFQSWAGTSAAASGGHGGGGGKGKESRGGGGKGDGGYSKGDERYGGAPPMPMGYGAGGHGHRGSGGGSPGIDLMMGVARELPPYVMDDSRGFALSCVVPNRLVGGLIGRGGACTKEVQANTGTKITIREMPDDPENRTMNIAGPLASTCAAYMLMMKRYLEVESDDSRPAMEDEDYGKSSKGKGKGKGKR